MNERLLRAAAVAILWACACLTGCNDLRVIVVPVGEPVILAAPIEAPVLVRNDRGEWVRANEPALIPAGWACWYFTPKDVE